MLINDMKQVEALQKHYKENIYNLENQLEEKIQ